jgi:riboflavin kinase/FMN adenylyltransferase
METYRADTQRRADRQPIRQQPRMGVSPPRRPNVVALGVFDGVHLGHQALLRELLSWAREARGAAGVVTFARHPGGVLEGHVPDFLTTLEHRLVLFERAGLDFTWVLDFTPELSRLTAEQFAADYLVGGLGARGLLLGADSRFGHDCLGPASPGLTALSRRMGLEIRAVPPVKCPDGQPISSTRIREAIYEGRLRDAAALLGRRVSVLGRVVPGAARGRRLGYATANLDVGREVRPPFGVYATLAELEGHSLRSITNVGYRPTVAPPCAAGEKPDLLIETHLLDFQGDLYGKTLEIHFVAKLRDERRFPDVQSLAEQIAKDEGEARALLEAQGL